MAEVIEGDFGGFGTLSADEVESVCAALHPRVVKLNMRVCGLDDSDAASLAASLKECTALDYLSISSNPNITSAGRLALTKFFLPAAHRLSDLKDSRVTTACLLTLLPSFKADAEATRARLDRMYDHGSQPSLIALFNGRSQQRTLNLPLSLIPKRVYERGAEDISAYFAALCQGGEDSTPRLVVSLIGSGNAGKTSIVQSLNDPSHLGRPTKPGPERATRGIAKTSLLIDSPNAPAVTVLDFGGQETYEQTHVLFHPNAGLALIVVDLAAHKVGEAESASRVLFYYEKLASLASSARILLVGTKADVPASADVVSRCQDVLKLVKKAEADAVLAINEELKSLPAPKPRQEDEEPSPAERRRAELTRLLESRPILVRDEVVPASCVEGEEAQGISTIADIIVQEAGAFGQRLPRPYVKLLDGLVAKRETSKTVPMIAMEETESLWRTASEDLSETADDSFALQAALQALSDTSEILWFPRTPSRVFIDPGFLVDAIKQVICHDLVDNAEGGKGTLEQTLLNDREPQEVIEKAKENLSERGLLWLAHLAKFDLWKDIAARDKESLPVMLALLESFGVANATQDEASKQPALYLPFALDSTSTVPELDLAKPQAVRLWTMDVFVPGALLSTLAVKFYSMSFGRNPGYLRGRNTFVVRSVSSVNADALLEVRVTLEWDARSPSPVPPARLFLKVTGPDPAEAFRYLAPYCKLVEDVLAGYPNMCGLGRWAVDPTDLASKFVLSTVQGLHSKGDKSIMNKAKTKPIPIEKLLGPKAVENVTAGTSQTKVKRAFFASHEWGEKREIHERVKLIVKALEGKGLKGWLDEEELKEDVDGGMSLGIDTSDVVLVFVTKGYRDKLLPDGRQMDNCRREFRYACFMKDGIKGVIPVVLDKDLCSHTQWKGELGLNLVGAMHVELTAERGKPEYEAQLDILAQRIIEARKGLGLVGGGATAAEADEATAAEASEATAAEASEATAAEAGEGISSQDPLPPPVAETRRPSGFLGGVRGLFFRRGSSAAVKR